MARTELVHSTPSVGLAEVLERVLDKGLVIAGDIKIKLCDVELLTIQIRLLVASVDKAREMGLTWWWQEQPAVEAKPLAAIAGPPKHASELEQPASTPWGHYLRFREIVPAAKQAQHAPISQTQRQKVEAPVRK